MTSSEATELPASLLLSAETLFERLSRARSAGDVSEPEEGFSSLLQPWSRAFAQGDLQSLARRLAWDGLSLARAATAFSPCTRSEPRQETWTKELAAFRREARNIAAEIESGVHGRLALWRERSGNRPFLELALPWVLAARASVLGSEGALPEGFTCEALDDLTLALLSSLGVLSEMAAFELFDGLREGGTGYERFVLDHLEEPLPRIYRDYPVLLRQTCTRVQQWRRSVVGLGERFLRDRQAIADGVFGGREVERIRRIRSGVSDRHEDGQEVFLLELENGESLVYKPRSVQLEWAVGEFFDWCRARGLKSVPRAPRVVVRDGYGWQELIRREELGGQDAARQYFCCAGSLAALSFLLRAQDLHAENLIATADGPVVIDGEMFLQPVVSSVATDSEGAGHQGLTASCLGTGLLTQPEWGSQGRIVERGGIRDCERRRVPKGARRWHEANTDSMLLEREDLWVETGDNAVRLGGEVIPAEEYRREILDGFESAYRVLLESRDELLDPEGPLSVFLDARVRILFRKSQDYAQILSLHSKPRFQRSGRLSSLVHEASLSIFAGRQEAPWLWPLVAEEREALDRGDIPHFTLEASETVLRSRDGDEIVGYFALSGLEAVRERARTLDEDDLEEQLTLVERCLEPRRALRVFELPPSTDGSADEEGDFAESCLAVAIGLGEELIERMAKDRDRIDNWSLGEGRLGIALFLAALGKSQQSSRFADSCLELVSSAHREPESIVQSTATIGGFSGLGSSVYGLSWIARLLDRKELLDLTPVLARGLTEERVSADRVFDIEGGAAGALMGVLAAMEICPSKELEGLASRCARHVMKDRRRGEAAGSDGDLESGVALAGFAHGAAGIARALAAYGELVPDEEVSAAVIEALDYERALYDHHRTNWPVLSRDPRRATPFRSWRNGWCHGAPGVALGRLLLPDHLKDAEVASELQAALTTTAARLPVGADHLCCGSLGRSAVLLAAADRLGEERWRAASRQIVHETLGRARRAGDFRLSPVPLENLRIRSAFLKGLAGIGYHLLRSSGARGLPDVLGLELPSETRKREELRHDE